MDSGDNQGTVGKITEEELYGSVERRCAISRKGIQIAKYGERGYVKTDVDQFTIRNQTLESTGAMNLISM